ncbi:MAG: hypothetical protein ACE5IP_12335 [Terriglobia bacterium]
MKNVTYSRPEIEIDNLRGYPPELIEELRGLVRKSGPPCCEPGRRVETREVVVRADLGRRGFYELETDGRVFYIAVSPRTGKILLLATWLEASAPRWQCEPSPVEVICDE